MYSHVLLLSLSLFLGFLNTAIIHSVYIYSISVLGCVWGKNKTIHVQCKYMYYSVMVTDWS